MGRGWSISDKLPATTTIAEGDLIGLTVTRESVLPDAEGGGCLVSVELLRNGEKFGVSISGLRLAGSREWFFAVSGESESISLAKLVV